MPEITPDLRALLTTELGRHHRTLRTDGDLTECKCGAWYADINEHLADALLPVIGAEVDPLWPCVCGHSRSQHQYDAVIGRNFCQYCPTATDPHEYEAASCACPDGPAIHQVGCPMFTPGTEG